MEQTNNNATPNIKKAPTDGRMVADIAKTTGTDLEKAVSHTSSHTSHHDVDLHLKEVGTYTVGEEEKSDNSDADAPKRTKDGKTILIPQPSDDPADPLNWSTARKWKVFISVLLPSLLTDWGMLWGTVLYESQAIEWNMSVTDVSDSSSGGMFLQGAGGILAVPFIQRYGRMPVLFWSQFLACMMVIGATFAPTYAGFTALRTLQGFFGTAPQVVALTMINDMFFFHERSRKINIWAFCLLIGPFLGPFIAILCSLQIGWRADFGVLAGFYGASTIAALFLSEETLYDRESPKAREIASSQGRLSQLFFIGGAKVPDRPQPWAVCKHLWQVGICPQILFPTACFTMIIFMWGIGITSTMSQFILAPPYLFSTTNFAMLYFAPMIGAVLGETWGHWFNDFLFHRYIRTHNGEYNPENRLWAVYPSTVFGIVALVLYGQALQHELSWVAIAFAWAMMTFATLSTTAAISSYAVDAFPHHSALASSMVNFWRTNGGFCVTYFQYDWVAHNGAGVSFGCQAAILAASWFAILATQICGKRWRIRFAPPEAEN
ncbi:MAG: hypothetical protein M1834_009201 [Cirrosporium novae-zelandiae]|nr:MAG: hypothetical protein M1834_009201 [Cirrosporium novae-zelandiae]